MSVVPERRPRKMLKRSESPEPSGLRQSRNLEYNEIPIHIAADLAGTRPSRRSPRERNRSLSRSIGCSSRPTPRQESAQTAPSPAFAFLSPVFSQQSCKTNPIQKPRNHHNILLYNNLRTQTPDRLSKKQSQSSPPATAPWQNEPTTSFLCHSTMTKPE